MCNGSTALSSVSFHREPDHGESVAAYFGSISHRSCHMDATTVKKKTVGMGRGDPSDGLPVELPALGPVPLDRNGNARNATPFLAD